MLILWGRNTSLNVQKPLWAMLELNIAFERIDAGGAFGKLDSPDYIAMNPNQRIPTLIDGDVVVWESNAVTRYVCAKWGQGSLWPEDAGQRARADMWMDWQQTTYMAAFIPLFNELVRVPPSKRNPDLIARQAKASVEAMALVDRWLDGRDYIAGKSLSMGDIPVGASLYRFFELPFERPALPNLERYYARLRERPAYQASAMTSFAPLMVTD